MSAVAENEIVRLGETFGKTVRFSAQDIAAFAAACQDSNPLHRDESEAGQSRFGEVIASGPHTAGINVGIGDGSVRFVGNGVDPNLWWFALTPQGGEVGGDW